MKNERPCPQCGEKLNRYARQCGECGWKKEGGTAEKKIDQQCAWDAAGQRCEFPGHSSDCTNGEGPWFCRFHRGCHDQRLGHAIVQESIAWKQGIGAEEITMPDGRKMPTYASTNAEADERQRSADEWCLDRGLDTAAKVRAYAKENKASVGKPKQIGYRIAVERMLADQAAGKVLLPIQLDYIKRSGMVSERQPGED